MQEPIPGTPTSVLRMGPQKNPQPGMWFGLAYGSGGGGVTEKTWTGGGGGTEWKRAGHLRRWANMHSEQVFLKIGELETEDAIQSTVKYNILYRCTVQYMLLVWEYTNSQFRSSIFKSQ